MQAAVDCRQWVGYFIIKSSSLFTHKVVYLKKESKCNAPLKFQVKKASNTIITMIHSRVLLTHWHQLALHGY